MRGTRAGAFVDSASAFLEVDAVDTGVEIGAHQRAVAPHLYGLECPLAEVEDGQRGDAGALEDFRGVFDLLLEPAIVLNDRRGEPHPIGPGDTDRYLIGRRLCLVKMS